MQASSLLFFTQNIDWRQAERQSSKKESNVFPLKKKPLRATSGYFRHRSNLISFLTPFPIFLVS
jgi:hypothetical protein